MNDLRHIVAENMVQLRKVQHLTQAELAEKLRYSDKAVSKWERGESLPDVTVLKEFADLCGVTVDYLITEHTPGEAAPPEKQRTGIKPLDRRHLLITALVICSVQVLITLAYVLIRLIAPQLPGAWLVYICAIPAISIILLVFDAIWNHGRLSLAYSSVLAWSILLTVFLFVLPFADISMIFFIGIPLQVMLILIFRLVKTVKLHKKD